MLLAICNACAHTVELDIDGLIGTLGPDHLVPAIRKRLRCTRCGSDIQYLAADGSDQVPDHANLNG